MGEEVTCFSGSNKGSSSEVQSLSSFQSDSCDDNGKTCPLLPIIQLSAVAVTMDARHVDTWQDVLNRKCDLSPGTVELCTLSVLCSSVGYGTEKRRLAHDRVLLFF